MDKPRARFGILEFTESVLGIRPYLWQRETLCHIEAGHPTALTACNGAGKTSTVLVAAALWCLFNWPLARVIVTSASWSQLKKQFFDTIRLQARHPLFRSHTFNEAEVRTPEGGFAIGLSVDEAGKAEGYHERPASPVMILADEAKSIHDDVFTSLARCTATWRVYASSAGPACGTFYSCLTTFRNFWACVLVKSSECPHISKESIEIDRQMWGEHSPQFRQKHLAEFTSEDEEAFIPMETVRACMDNPPPFQGGRSAAFVDWSTGGDETVIASAQGNRIRIVAAFRERDAVQCVRRVARILRDQSHLGTALSADAGGIGGPMCAQLAELGIYATRVHNGSPARKKEEFADLAAERWFAFRRLLEKREVILPIDGELLKQLSSRRLQYDSKARIQLEPKESMRGRGLSSPDRADAVIGAAVPCFTGSITMDTLAGMQVGPPQGGRALFDFEPVTFE
jgi:phage terminase large subunit